MQLKPILNKINDQRIGFVFAGLTFFLISYILRVNLIVAISLLVLFLYAKFRGFKIKNYRFLYLFFLFVANVALTYFMAQRRSPVFYMPFGIVPMLATLLFNNLEVSLIITLASAVTVGSFWGGNFYLMLFFLLSGLTSSLLVRDARRRISIINAGIITGLIQALSLFFIGQFFIGSHIKYGVVILNGIISSIIVVGILPVFEYLFKTVTNISLLEMADFNHPLLQRLNLEAPGTYHHSLVVGNLSDIACRAIGANALLARIGAYYHDIGKLQKPEYFSENQELGSKHDTLSADMSRLVIINHVKEGMELAKKYKLNPRIADFIIQHHGNSLVYYFYRRALENLENDQEIKEEGFRYPGPKPDTKEAAIVLLADSVEAAARALKEPNSAKIEEVVHKMINNKFIDGQLDECELTLKDLEKIAAVFVRALCSIYHSRITYPEHNGLKDNNKKPAKEDSRQTEKDQKSGS